MKVCRSCSKEKPLESFIVSANCAPCRVVIVKNWRARHRNYVLERQRAYYEKRKSHINARRRVKRIEKQLKSQEG